MFNKRKLPMRVAFLTLLVFVAICAGGYCYQTLHTPEYALEQTRKAIRERDKDLLERYVDIDSIISGCVKSFV